METNEMYLKTAFCCMACDGNIADEEVSALKQYISTNHTDFSSLNLDSMLNSYVESINSMGAEFLKNYLDDISEMNLSEEEQLNVIRLAINLIEADNNIDYSEIAFFKKIRLRLSISDESILENMPDKGDYLLPDIIEDKFFDFTPSFTSINIC